MLLEAGPHFNPLRKSSVVVNTGVYTVEDAVLCE